jgi:hypothetical protein
MTEKMPAKVENSPVAGLPGGEPPSALVPQPLGPVGGLFGGGTVVPFPPRAPLRQVPLEQRWDQVEQALAQNAKLCAQVKDLADSVALALVQLQEIRRLLVVLDREVQADFADRGR